jgi:hypothetical protein
MPDTVDTVIRDPGDGWRYHPKHVERFRDINKLYIVAQRKIFRIYGPKHENGEWKSRTNRELEEMSKGQNMDKRAKDKLVRSPRENGGG